MTLLLLTLFLLIFLGMPIVFSLGISSLVYFIVYNPELLIILPQRIFSGLSNYNMLALPMFILMGTLMNESGITRQLIGFCDLLVGRLKGGLGCINIAASMLFGGISGSSVSDTASIGAIMIPEMHRKGYDMEFAAGVTVASSTVGIIIPPSIPMLLFCASAEQSVGAMFMAGLLPGLLIGVVQLALCILISYHRNYPTSNTKFSLRNFWSVFKDSFLAVLMPLFVMGSIIMGLATATEGATVGVVYALLIGFFVFRSLKRKMLPKMLTDAMCTAASIMMIIAISQMYIWILALERIPETVAAFVGALQLSPTLLLVFIMIIILITGTFLDVSPAIIILTPVFLPLAQTAGISAIQFGTLLICGMAVGQVTPPVGSCLNVASAIAKRNILVVAKGALPFIGCNILVLLLICLFPVLSLWLPSLL